ncbi:MAG: nucleoside-triphosphatase [Candidatus Obscuribacterales bacterium]
MKILLTAPPGTGKSTIIDAVVAAYPGRSVGIVAREKLDESGDRAGFVSVDSRSQRRQFMYRANEGPGAFHGFDVDVEAIDDFVVPELERSLSMPEALLYIDEIGRAQALSNRFLLTLEKVFERPGPTLASIVYEEEPWSHVFRRHPQTVLIEATMANREALPAVLLAAINAHQLYMALSEPQRGFVRKKLSELIESGHLTSAAKLFNNALAYVLEKRIEQAGPGSYVIEGKTKRHQLTLHEGGFVCDCDLSNGRGDFAGTRQPCSHYLSIQISKH